MFVYTPADILWGLTVVIVIVVLLIATIRALIKGYTNDLYEKALAKVKAETTQTRMDAAELMKEAVAYRNKERDVWMRRDSPLGSMAGSGISGSLYLGAPQWTHIMAYLIYTYYNGSLTLPRSSVMEGTKLSLTIEVPDRDGDIVISTQPRPATSSRREG